jgi:diguanylate cyclase (GGDEF)-like protein/PAS domain S-box-containing protein
VEQAEQAQGTGASIDELPAPLLAIDAAGGCVLNRRAVEVLGPPAVRTSVLELFASADREPVAHLLAAARDGGLGSGVFRLEADEVIDDGATSDGSTPEGVQVDVGTRATLARFCELSLGRADETGVVVHALALDVTDAVRDRGVLEAAVPSAWIVDDRARQLWGPVGHSLESTSEAYQQGTMADRLHPEDMSTAIDAFFAALAEPGGRRTLEARGRHPLKPTTWTTSEYEFANLTEDPRVGGLVIITKQTHDREDVASLARTSGAHLSVAEAAPVGIILTGPHGLPIHFNEAARKLLPGAGIDDDGLLERDWTKLAARGDEDRLHALLAETVETCSQRSMLARFSPRHDLDLWVLTTISPRLAEDGRQVGLVITLQDVTAEIEAKEQLERAQQQLLHLANHDPLTGLVNRARLADELAARLHDRPEGRGLALLFCDLDGFKAINDRFGHGAGDELLAAAASRLSATVEQRCDDAVVARVGGDEFVVVVEGADEGLERAAGEIGGSLVDALGRPFDTGAGRGTIGVSIGIARARDGDDPESIVQRADVAMYEAKALGRGRVVHAA